MERSFVVGGALAAFCPVVSGSFDSEVQSIAPLRCESRPGRRDPLARQHHVSVAV